MTDGLLRYHFKNTEVSLIKRQHFFCKTLEYIHQIKWSHITKTMIIHVYLNDKFLKFTMHSCAVQST
jgi:hypothetical protein